MASDLESDLARLTDSAKRLRAPRDLPARLRLLAALLRDAPSIDHGPRLLWRDATGRVCAITIDRPLVIGRDAACQVVLTGARVSRQHCVVQPATHGAEIADLQSANGTFVNGARLPRGPLHDGDMVEVGGVGLAFVSGGAG